MVDDPSQNLMVQFERACMEANMDDWFVSDYNLDYVAMKEYRIYLAEQGEECEY